MNNELNNDSVDHKNQIKKTYTEEDMKQAFIDGYNAKENNDDCVFFIENYN